MKHFIFGGLVSLGSLAFLAGCGDEVKTVQYYEQHLDEAKEKDKKCQEQGILSAEQQADCANAKKAVLFAPDDRVPWGKGK